MSQQKVGVVLSGGGAYGFAHIGVLQVLQENNIPVDIIAGTSMGSLIGGLYAAGISIEQMIEITSKFKRRDFLDINLFAIASSGLLFGKKVVRLLNKIVGKVNIEDFAIKYSAVACDLKNSKKVSIRKGDLVDAIRASISIPGVFMPVKRNGMCMVDGGLVDNLPVSDAREMGADIVIASDVCSFYKPQKKLNNVFDIILSSANVLTSQSVIRQKDKGEVYIKIDQPNITQDGFSKEEIAVSIKNGRRETLKLLPKIKELLNIK